MMKTLRKGFTLIELLVTIAVLAVVMAAVLGAINPQQKIFAARDAQSQSGVGQLGTALQSWSSQTAGGTYPATLAQLVTDGEMPALPPFPAGVTSWNYQVGATNVAIYAAMQAARNIALGATWCWRSATNVAGFSTVAACVP